MSELIITNSIIMFIFFTIWIIKYPQQLWESITFRLNEGIVGYFWSVVIWIFQTGFIYTIFILASYIGKELK